MLRYYRNHFEGVEAIQYLVYLMGAILMQEAQSTQLIQQVLIQLLSEKKMMEYLANIDCLRKIKEEDILSKEEMEKIFSRLDNKDGEEEVIRFDIPSDINLEDLSNNLEDLLTE
jgi:chaperonin GroEL (HSP60 family)